MEEEELTLGEEFALMDAEFDTLIKRKNRMEKRFGKKESRPEKQGLLSLKPKHKDVATLVKEALVKFNLNNRQYFLNKENIYPAADIGFSINTSEMSELAGKEFLIETEDISVTWSPDLYLPFRLDKNFQVRVSGFWKISAQKKMFLWIIRKLEC